MRCSCIKCLYNNEGYCEDSSYITIDEHGECENMLIIEAEDGE